MTFPLACGVLDLLFAFAGAYVTFKYVAARFKRSDTGSNAQEKWGTIAQGVDGKSLNAN